MAFNWKTDFPSAAVSRTLIERIDSVIALIDTGDLDGARYLSYLSRWIRDIDLTGIPAEVLFEAKVHSDEAARHLDPWDPHPEQATAALLSARELLT